MYFMQETTERINSGENTDEGIGMSEGVKQEGEKNM